MKTFAVYMLLLPVTLYAILLILFETVQILLVMPALIPLFNSLGIVITNFKLAIMIGTGIYCLLGLGMLWAERGKRD